LGRSAGGKKHCRSHSRTECKPARHDATSRFCYEREYSFTGTIWQTKLVDAARHDCHKNDTRQGVIERYS
jgi:hypothetical protein